MNAPLGMKGKIGFIGLGLMGAPLARLAPAEMRTGMFGLYALSGKATAFIGPALVGWVTVATNSQQLGMSTILVFFLVGLVLMVPVRET